MVNETILILSLSLMATQNLTSNISNLYEAEYKIETPTFSAEEIEQLNNLISSYGEGVSVYFEDMTSGFS